GSVLDHEHRRLSGRIFRKPGDQGLSGGLGHHRHRAWPDVAGVGLCPAASLHGRRGRQCRRLGLCARWHGGDHPGADCQPAGGGGRTGDGVGRILVRGGRAVGVVLANGDEVRGRRVISNMDVKRTFLKHVDEAELPGDFVKRVKAFKIRGSSGKLNIALDSAPVFPALPEGAPNIRGDLHFTDSIEKMERGYDDWKNGHFSRDPFQDVMIPTMIDPTMTPPGKHFMSCFVQYAPPRIEGRDWTDADRDAFRDTCLDQIETYSPGFKDRVLHVEVRTPRELEAEVGLTEGNIFQ